MSTVVSHEIFVSNWFPYSRAVDLRAQLVGIGVVLGGATKQPTHIAKITQIGNL